MSDTESEEDVPIPSSSRPKRALKAPAKKYAIVDDSDEDMSEGDDDEDDDDDFTAEDSLIN